MQLDVNAVISNLLTEIAEKARTIAVLKAQLSAVEAQQAAATRVEAVSEGPDSA